MKFAITLIVVVFVVSNGVSCLETIQELKRELELFADDEKPQTDHGEMMDKKEEMEELLDELEERNNEEPQFEHGELLNERGEGDGTGAKLHKFFPCFTGGEEFEIKMKTESMYIHNVVRDNHYGKGKNRLTWDPDLAKSAKKHAEAMADAQDMYHSDAAGSAYGENVAFSGIGVKTSEDIVLGPALMGAKWYEEITHYDYNTHKKKASSPPEAMIGHFTQMVWRSTTKIGCGLATAEKEGTWHKTYYACQYYPPGNVGSQYANNVPEPLDGNYDGIPPQDLNVRGCCNYMSTCKKLSKFCNAVPALKDICAISCNTCTAS